MWSLTMIKRYQNTALPQYILIVAILVAAVFLAFISVIAMQRVPFVDNFGIPWAASRAWLLEGVSPYSPEIIRIADEALTNSGFKGVLPDENNLLIPLINLFFYIPFSLLPYTISRAIWMVILVISIVLIIYFSIMIAGWKLNISGKISITALLVVWFPGIYMILTGGLSPIVILIIVIAIRLIIQGRDQTAGFMLALTFGSLPTTILIFTTVIFWIISKRRWSILFAYLSGVAFLILVSLLMLPSWPQQWLRVILNTYQDFSWVQTPLMVLAKVLPGISNFLSITLHALLGIYLLILWITLLGKTERVFIWKFLVVLVIAFLLHTQATISELFLLIPAVFLVFRYTSERWGIVGKISNIVLLFLFTIGSWFLALPEICFTGRISFPILITGLPIFALIGMMWIRWWSIELPKVPES